MSESKASLIRDRDNYKIWEAEERQRRWDDRERHEKFIRELDEVYKAGLQAFAKERDEIIDAIENVYGISVETLLKAHAYKLKQARDGELMDAYTEAINAPEAKPKGKN